MVKIFKFEVTNAASRCFESDKKDDWYYKKISQIKSPQDIELTINDFIEDKEVIDIKINTVDSQYHNNGRGNTVEMWYTIIYK